MKLCRYSTAAGPMLGRIVDEMIVPVAGDAFGTLRDDGTAIPLAGAQLLPPVIPSTFFCAGLNYRHHIEEAQRRGVAAKVPERPDVGYRANNALIGHDADIVKPYDCTGDFEYEGELVAVIGRDLRRVSRREAADGIFGWTIGNDVSARAWQRSDRTLWRAKNSDTFKPMGPWIDTAAEPMQSETRVFVNGALSSSCETGDMIFSAIDFIVEITRYVTMRAGDVLWLGTDAIGPMAPGDTVEVEISKLGRLRNRVVAEAAPSPRA